MLASVLLDEVGAILNDLESGNEHVRWPVSELLLYLTEAVATIAQAKPAAFIIADRISLAPGTTQRLPDQFCKLIDIHHNINPDGSEGPAVLPAGHDLLQAFYKPTCSYDGVIQSFSYFSSSDRYFGVAPAVPVGLTYTPQVQAVVMLTPQAVTSESQPLYMPGSDPQLYQGALADWVLYRCYSKDQEANTSLERSQMHLRAFQVYVGFQMPSAQQARRPSVAQARAAV